MKSSQIESLPLDQLSPSRLFSSAQTLKGKSGAGPPATAETAEPGEAKSEIPSLMVTSMGKSRQASVRPRFGANSPFIVTESGLASSSLQWSTDTTAEFQLLLNVAE